MCGQWGTEGYVRKGAPAILEPELTFEQLRSTFDDLATFKPRVILCGGETFLYPQWKEVIAYLARKGLRTSIITNGTRLADAAQDLVASQVEEISISLDGPEEVHDTIRGTKGTFQKVEEGIKALLRERELQGRYYPRLGFNSTLSDLTYTSLIRLIETVESSGVDSLLLLHFNFIDSQLLEAHQETFQRLFGKGCPSWEGFVYDTSGMDMDALIRIVREVKGRKFAIPVDFLPDYNEMELTDYYTGKQFYPSRPRGICRGLWNTVNVLPNGDISPCLDVVVGNIQEEGGLIKAWNAAPMRRFRSILKKEGLFPACTRCCTYYRF